MPQPLASRAAPIARIDGERLIAADGAALPLRTWLPAGEPGAVALALHGFNDYSNAFASVGPRLAAAGIAAYAYDQRGFGGAPARGRWAGAEVMADDALAALRLLRRRHAGVPAYLIGESMGGAVAVLAANRAVGEAAPDRVVLLAPAVWTRASMNIFERTGLWLADFVPWVQWSARMLPVRLRPTDNDAVLRGLAADPLVIKSTRSDTLNGLVDLMSAALADAPRFAANSLILYGGRDQIVPRAPVARFVAALPASVEAQQRVAFYPRGYHLLLRDLSGQQVVADVLAWLADPSAPLPSGADRDGRARLAGRALARAEAPAAGTAPWRPARS